MTKVLLIGDSITAQYHARAIALLKNRGFDATGYGYPGAGLLDPDWSKGRVARIARKATQPDIVVFENIGNYFNPILSAPYGSQAFFSAWEKSALKQMRIFKDSKFYWMLHPLIQQQNASPKLNDIYRKIGTRFVDCWSAFGGSSYNASLHVPDGVHLNDAGIEKMASVVAASIE